MLAANITFENGLASERWLEILMVFPNMISLNPFPCYRRLLSSAYNVSKLVDTLTVFPKECFYHINLKKK